MAITVEEWIDRFRSGRSVKMKWQNLHIRWIGQRYPNHQLIDGQNPILLLGFNHPFGDAGFRNHPQYHIGSIMMYNFTYRNYFSPFITVFMAIIVG